MKRHGTRAGLTILETLAALVIFSLAALVILRSGGSIHERSYQNEFHAMAAIRARTLASFARALDFDVLKKLVGTGGQLRPLELEKLFEPGELDFALKPPAGTNPLCEQKLKDFSHQVSARVMGDRIELEVLVHWNLPGERKSEPHEYRLLTAWHRPGATFTLAEVKP